MRLWLLAVVPLAGCARVSTPVVQLKKASAPVVNVPMAFEVYFVRHGETVSNATGVYKDSTLNVLTPAGEAQAKFVAQTLKDIPFDAAIVSPSLRAEKTAAETLREHHLVATIWPEMNECCTQHGAARNEVVSYRLPKGGAVTVPKGFADILQVGDGDTTMFAPKSYSDGIVQTTIAATRFDAFFSHQVKPGTRVYRVLVVGHAAQGSRFLDLLLWKKAIGDIEIKNGSITILHREPGTKFILMKTIINPNKSRQDAGKMSSKTEK